MPLYEYECEADGNRFEVIQKFSDAPLTTCPTCGGTVRRLLSSPAIQFKGSGWYITDYARKGRNTNSGPDKSDKSDKSEKPAAADAQKSSPSTSPATSAGSSPSGSAGSSS
jgi:putative FmdB family regulatory protein